MNDTRKPLQLTIHPPAAPEPEDNLSLEWFAWHGDRSMEQLFGEWKRLTDAELAAECWAWTAHMNRMQWCEESLQAQGEPPWPESTWEALGERNSTLYRFATLPHYDEGQA